MKEPGLVPTTAPLCHNRHCLFPSDQAQPRIKGSQSSQSSAEGQDGRESDISSDRLQRGINLGLLY